MEDAENIEVKHVSKPAEMTWVEKVDCATEVAFGSLLRAAANLGLPLDPVMGLMYLPQQETTVKFQEACRAVIDSLTP